MPFYKAAFLAAKESGNCCEKLGEMILTASVVGMAGLFVTVGCVLGVEEATKRGWIEPGWIQMGQDPSAPTQLEMEQRRPPTMEERLAALEQMVHDKFE